MGSALWLRRREEWATARIAAFVLRRRGEHNRNRQPPSTAATPSGAFRIRQATCKALSAPAVGCGCPPDSGTYAAVMTTEPKGKAPRPPAPTTPTTEDERPTDEMIEEEDARVAASEAEDIEDEDAAAAADAESGRIPTA